MNTLSIVIPIYNEEAILEKEVESIVKQMQETLPAVAYELILVENGSFDRTRKIVESLTSKYAVIRPLYLPTAGYGPALKRGLLESTGEFIVLFNIDFWDVGFIHKALELRQEKDLDMVVGSKTMPGAEDTRPLVRRAITQTFNWLLRSLFGFSGTDTHGIKLLRRAKILPVIEACKTEREIFDTEFVMRAQLAGLTSEEIPVVCQEKRQTTYHIAKRIPRTAKDLLVLFFSLRWQKINKGYLLSLIAIIVFFISAVSWGFPNSPSPWFDNGINLGIVKTYVQDGVYSLRLAPGVYVDNRPLMISTNYPLLGWIILAFKLFGVGLAQAQVVMIGFLIAYLILASRLIRRWYGQSFAPWSLALIVTFLPFYGDGMSGGLGEVPGLVYLFLSLWFLERTNQGESHRQWAGSRPRREKSVTWPLLTGLFFGLCGATKVFYAVALVALAMTEIVKAIQQRGIPWRRWFFMGLGLVPPLLIWLRTLIPGGLQGAAIERALTYYQNPYAVTHTTLPNFLRFITETTPIHFAGLIITVFVFFACRIQTRQLRQAEAVIGLFVIFTILYWSRTPGWYRYFFPAHLLMLTLFPAALFHLRTHWREKRWVHGGIVVMMGLLVLIQAVHFVRERGGRLYYNPAPRQFAAELDRDLGGGADILVIDHPEIAFLLKNRQVQQYVTMNPYVAFGKKVFVDAPLPEYIVSGEPAENPYLAPYLDDLRQKYDRIRQLDAYVLFKKK